MLGLGGAGAEFRPPRAVWHNPIAWREAAARNSTLGRILARWSFIAAGALWGIGLVAMYYGGGLVAKDFQLALTATVIGELAVTTLVGINMAATAVSREREDGTLDLLLTTPITPGQYLTGKLRGLIAYLLPLLAVPIGTLLLAGLYVVADGFGGRGDAVVKVQIARSALPQVAVPVVLPETGLLAALVFVPFMAFVVMTGLQWSLKSKGTLSSVVGTGGGDWGAGLGVFGAALAAASPASLVLASVHPEDVLRGAMESSGLDAARVALVIGAMAAAGVYIAWVYGVHAHMVRTFDFTVRKLAGVK
jgi:ABC-type Na+ efflux pump permease subunit